MNQWTWPIAKGQGPTGATNGARTLLGTSASLLVTGASLLGARFATRGSWRRYERSKNATGNKKLYTGARQGARQGLFFTGSTFAFCVFVAEA